MPSETISNYDFQPEKPQGHLPIKSISKGDHDWPDRLRDLSDMPDSLYYLGKLPDDSRPAVAIIGSRLCSPYGHRQAQLFAETLAGYGVQIISGMAVGIDGYAQEAALKCGGDSFGILASGPEICYPPSNKVLYDRLPFNGGLISEYAPGTKPSRWQFVHRNRLISAFSDIVLVVEAKRKSGTNITVDYALQQGKSVYAVPGHVGDPLSDGCNYLISQGAGIAWSPDALLQELHIFSDQPSEDGILELLNRQRIKQDQHVMENEHFSEPVKKVYGVLSYEDTVTADCIVEKTGLTTAEVLAALTSILLEGIAEENPRGSFRRHHP